MNPDSKFSPRTASAVVIAGVVIASGALFYLASVRVGMGEGGGARVSNTAVLVNVTIGRSCH